MRTILNALFIKQLSITTADGRLSSSSVAVCVSADNKMLSLMKEGEEVKEEASERVMKLARQVVMDVGEFCVVSWAMRRGVEVRASPSLTVYGLQVIKLLLSYVMGTSLNTPVRTCIFTSPLTSSPSFTSFFHFFHFLLLLLLLLLCLLPLSFHSF